MKSIPRSCTLGWLYIVHVQQTFPFLNWIGTNVSRSGQSNRKIKLVWNKKNEKIEECLTEHKNIGNYIRNCCDSNTVMSALPSPLIYSQIVLFITSTALSIPTTNRTMNISNSRLSIEAFKVIGNVPLKRIPRRGIKVHCNIWMDWMGTTHVPAPFPRDRNEWHYGKFSTSGSDYQHLILYILRLWWQQDLVLCIGIGVVHGLGDLVLANTQLLVLVSQLSTIDLTFRYRLIQN